MAGMTKWPRAKRIQLVIAFTAALLSAGLVFVHFATESFDHYYFPPHKAYPYPYPTELAARIVMWRYCSLTFLGVFAIVYVAQRKLMGARNTGKSN
jgi:hypothetical protein